MRSSTINPRLFKNVGRHIATSNGTVIARIGWDAAVKRIRKTRIRHNITTTGSTVVWCEEKANRVSLTNGALPYHKWNHGLVNTGWRRTIILTRTVDDNDTMAASMSRINTEQLIARTLATTPC